MRASSCSEIYFRRSNKIVVSINNNEIDLINLLLLWKKDDQAI